MNYYNDNNPHSVAWIKALIEDGLIPKGVVDERSITDVVPADLAGFDQCHFFAGIAGWPLALGLAGWPADQPVWTASCPCQPFSIAGTGKGTSDRRHLFPELRRLIEACRPSITFGEQVASAAGREWLAGVFNDLEEIGYEVAGADLCASGVSSPQVRQRICWMAHRNDEGRERWVCRREDQEWEDLNGHAGCDCVPGGRMASAGCDVTECTEGKGQRSGDQSGTGASDKPDRCRPARPWDNSVWIECRDNKARRIPSGSQSSFLLLADGFFYRLADVLSEISQEAINAIKKYASETNSNPNEVLSLVQKINAEKVLRKKTGGLGSIQEKEILFTILWDSLPALNGAPNDCGIKKKGKQTDPRELRDLRKFIQDQCSSYRRESEKQFQGQPSGALLVLSQFLACCDEACRDYEGRANAAAFPLAHKVKGRVAILAGLGNSIVPELLSEFILAGVDAL